jgi:arylsulfatase A-like enzyme
VLRHGQLPGDPREVAALVDLYDGEVAYADAEIGRLLDGLPPLVRAATLIVVTSDHGEEFGDHGGLFHSVTLFEEQLRVPLIMAGAMSSALIPRGRVIAAPISQVGLWATLANLIGLDGSPTGWPFARLLIGHTDAPVEPSFADLVETEPQRPIRHTRAVIDGRWKLLVPPTGEVALFDLVADAGEHRDVAAAKRPHLRALQRLLDVHDAAAAVARGRTGPGTAPISDEERARLEALGYARAP